MKNFILYFFLLMMSITVNSQSLNDKRDSYDKEKARIEKLEKEVEYSGDDEFIRQRNNLPPKLPPFEEWVENNSPKNIETKQDLSNFPQQENNNNKTNNDNSSKKQGETATFSKTTFEISILLLIGSIFLALNFAGSIFLPKYRYLFISVPFDIGVKEVKNGAQISVKGKRTRIEFFLLVLVFAIYLFVAISDKMQQEEDLMSALSEGLVTALFGYLGYVTIRIIWGLKSKCPKCKNMFASNCINSYDEPSGTFQKKTLSGKGYNGGRLETYNYTVATIEKGTTHKDFICAVCSHEWHTRSSYQKTIDSHELREPV